MLSSNFSRGPCVKFRTNGLGIVSINQSLPLGLNSWEDWTLQSLLASNLGEGQIQNRPEEEWTPSDYLDLNTSLLLQS